MISVELDVSLYWEINQSIKAIHNSYIVIYVSFFFFFNANMIISKLYKVQNKVKLEVEVEMESCKQI